MCSFFQEREKRKKIKIADFTCTVVYPMIVHFEKYIQWKMCGDKINAEGMTHMHLFDSYYVLQATNAVMEIRKKIIK